MNELAKAFVTEHICNNTRTFGGGRKSEFNPIMNALSDKPPQFAAGVSVNEVIDLVIEGIEKAKQQFSDAADSID